MTLTTTHNRVEYTGTGLLSSYHYNFKVFNDTDLTVIRVDLDGNENTLILGIHYSVDGEGNSLGGFVNLLDGNLALNYRLIILRDLPLNQPTHFRNQGAFFPERHEDAYDRSLMVSQQLQEQIDRAMIAPVSAPSGFSYVLPRPDPDHVLAWNAAGTAIVSTTAISVQGMQDLISNTDVAKGAALVGYRHNLTGAVGRTLSTKLLELLSVDDFGAVGDGETDDADAIQAALNAAVGKRLLFTNGKTYVVEKAITIMGSTHLMGNGAILYLTDHDLSWIEIVQSVAIDYLVIEDFIITGIPETRYDLPAIGNYSGTTVEHAIFRNITFKNHSFGLNINQQSAGYFLYVSVENCLFDTMYDESEGVVSGQGLGLACSLGFDTAGRPDSHVHVSNCIFKNTGRHALYVDSGNDVIVENCVFLNHRVGNTLQTYNLAALQLSGCKNILVNQCKFYDNNDTALWFTGREGGDADNCIVSNCLFRNGNKYDILVGQDSPDINGTTSHVLIQGNMTYHTATNQYSSIQIQSCINLKVCNNMVDASALSVSHYGMVTLHAYGSTYPSNYYLIENNYILMPLTGVARAFNINPTNILGGTAVVLINKNHVIANSKWSFAGAHTNVNFIYKFYVDDLRIVGSSWSDQPLILGAYYLWVDSTGDLRIKSGAPVSDTDGTVVGAQT